jgi:hypothetical protein
LSKYFKNSDEVSFTPTQILFLISQQVPKAIAFRFSKLVFGWIPLRVFGGVSKKSSSLLIGPFVSIISAMAFGTHFGVGNHHEMIDAFKIIFF